MANNHSISEFIGEFNGGFRPNRFRVQGDFGSAGTKTTTFHVRSSTIPSSSLTTIMLPYRGRNFKMPGVRTYTPWQITVLDDSKEAGGISLWEDFHDWSERINSHKDNITTSTSLNFDKEMATWTVFQLDINGKEIKQIDLLYCWPAEVSPITLNMDDNESLSTFSVTMEYSYYERKTPTTKTNTNTGI
jgi:hypothetical protein